MSEQKVTARAQFELDVSMLVRIWFKTLFDQRDYLPPACRTWLESRTPDQASEVITHTAEAIAGDGYIITGNAIPSPTFRIQCQVTVDLGALVEAWWEALAHEATGRADGELISADIAQAFADVPPSVWDRIKPALLFRLGSDFRPYMTADNDFASTQELAAV